MSEKLTLRALVFDDDEAIRLLLWRYFDGRGYEVFTFPHPRACPICDVQSCVCPLEESCADIIISDLEMPHVKGLEFLEKQISKGCKCRNLALMSGNVSKEEHETAASCGITVFKKPFRIRELDAWVRSVEATIPRTRRLSDWFLGNSK